MANLSATLAGTRPLSSAQLYCNSLMGLSLSKKTEFQAGHPWKSPEEELFNSKTSPDYVAPPTTATRPFYDPSPLITLPPGLSQTEKDSAARIRAVNADCIMYTLETMKYPTIIGVAWGSTLASYEARPDISKYSRHVVSGWTEAGKGFMKELKFLKSPTLMLGGYAALFAVTDCSVAKVVEYDGVFNTAVAASVTGTALGLQQRCSNKMFVGAFWGGVLGAMLKWAYLDEDVYRPVKTYYERVESRKRQCRPEYAEKMKDGYLHQYLDPQLKKLGLKLPESWETAN